GASRSRLAHAEASTMLAPPSETVVRGAVLDMLPSAVIAIDREGKLAVANLQARVQFGISPRDLGRPIQDLEISFRPLELRSRIEQTYTQRHPVSMREVEWRPHHETRFLDIQLTPIGDPTGEIAGCSITFTDV